MIMKKIFLLLSICCVLSAKAQFNNEWIDYSKTYYKFKVGKTSLCRINASVLQSVNLQNTPVQQFQLWRNGQQVPIYTSVATGTIGSGYIEFWGEKNDGKPDTKLYTVPAFQINDKVSLQTDTVAYFLTVNTNTANNLRVTDLANNVAGNSLPATPWFQYTYRKNFEEFMNPGYASIVATDYVHSSKYDVGEMLSTFEIYPTNPKLDTAGNLYPAITAPAPVTLSFAGAGTALNFRTATMYSINGATEDSVVSTFFDSFNPFSATRNNININSIGGTNTIIKLRNSIVLTPSTQFDRIVVSYYEISYPRLFNFGGANQFAFQLPPSNVGHYLDIANFNFETTAPVLYVNGRERMEGVISGSNVRFVLPASTTNYNLVLSSKSNTALNNISSLTSKTFVNYAQSTNQGDYLLISSPSLNSTGAIDQYRTYRSSTAGGSFNVKVYDVDELVDQFAFGIKKHPLSIKNFVAYARQTFSVQPKCVYLIGHGMSYNYYRFAQSHRLADQLNTVPTFGYPASDQLFTTNGYVADPLIPIGRLSVINAQEIIDYLNKVRQYEQAQASTIQTLADKRWMKNVVHVVGANDLGLDVALSGYMNNYKAIAEDTLWGAKVTSLNKTNANTGVTIQSQLLENLFAEGISLLTYYGHSSATVLDFNLDDPNRYNNPGKYPLFFVNGCNAGDFYKFDTSRFTLKNTISENFVLAPNRGAIGFLASTHFGLVNFLNTYITGFYRGMSKDNYNATIPKSTKRAIDWVYSTQGAGQYFSQTHTEQTTLHGDPAIFLNQFSTPDYVMEEEQIQISPSYISVADPSFRFKTIAHNIGKAKRDSLQVTITRELPEGGMRVIFDRKIKPVYYNDSVELTIPINPNTDRGINKITVELDRGQLLPEISELNNKATRSFIIYSDEIRPVYPYNFSIVGQQNIRFAASTADPLEVVRPYLFELDTTELFNSPAKIAATVSSIGGVVEFTPTLTFRDSTVYYWRTASQNATDRRWNNSSFVFLANAPVGISGNFGSNQSHFYQHTKSLEEQLRIDSASRLWRFKTKNNNLFIVNSIFPTSGNEDQHWSIAINNDATRVRALCVGSSLTFNAFSDVTFEPWLNARAGDLGRLGSNFDASNTQRAICAESRAYNFEYTYKTPQGRDLARRFMDSVPDGYYVTVRLVLDQPYNIWAQDWKNIDEPIYGVGNTLYSRLKTAGFAQLDSFNRPRTWVFVYRKNRSQYTPVYKFSEGLFDRINFSVDCPTPDISGAIVSPLFGRSRAWKKVYWNGYNIENTGNDRATLDIIGVRGDGREDTLQRLNALAANEYDISGISATTYPFMKLRLSTKDSVQGTPYQLRYWRIYYDPVPEGGLTALAGNSNTIDSVDQGQRFNFAIAFKNISNQNFADSMRIRQSVFSSASNTTTNFNLPRGKRLNTGDTILFNNSIPTDNLRGEQLMSVDFNPDFEQPEQTRFNNFVIKRFFVRADTNNPVMDVVFDGVHILNEDIVSAKPLITIKLKDENRFLLLNDTALFEVRLRYPDGVLRNYRFNTDTLRLIPPSSGTDNSAIIEFRPNCNVDVSGSNDLYELIATAKDRAGNRAGNLEYRVKFRVINKSLITNVFNYPNPFTTSTAFVFTLSGSEVPENIRIQILTVTGKVVREITKQEMGPIHIGRNITEYKWDGTDQYGNLLANGVYLYRVITHLNGQPLDLLNISGGKETSNSRRNETGKYFTEGYGKMYLMR
jgi:hypothetical protein